MQTFLPYKNYLESVQCLDYKRLGKQRVEADQILKALQLGSKSRWRNHPAVKMWKGFEECLVFYINASIYEWSKRGYRNNMQYIIIDLIHLDYPWWLTDEFCNSHRSNLLRKDYNFYSKYNWDVPDNLPYIWPVR